MSDRADARLTPAMVLAVLALALSLVGTAVAGPAALTSKITKPKVKKIAKREIAKAAPGLSVASADAADSVDGFDAGDLIRTTSGSTADAPDADGTAATAAIQAPGSGFLTVFATADFVYGAGNTTDQVECLLEIDGAEVPATSRVTNVSSFANVDSDCATNATAPVSAGAHEVDLEIAQINDTGVGAAAVSVFFTPFGGTGAGG